MTPKKIAAFALGPVAGAALGFITLPLVTWFFSQEDVGRMAMLNVACLEEIALNNGWLTKQQVLEIGQTMSKNAYGQYLISLAQE